MEEQVKLMEKRIENQDKKLDEIMKIMREMKEATCNNSNNSSESPRVINNTGGIKTLGYTPKIEFPKFDGSGSRNWVKKCVKYFSLCNIPEEQRVDLASLHMVDKAEIWMTNYLSIRKNVEWSEFVMDLNARFNDETGCNVVEQFNKLQQTGTIEACIDEFDNLTLFGQSTGTSSVSTFSFTPPTATSSALPSLSQPQPVFESRYAVRATGNSGDQMNMEDSMAELDPVHSSNPSVPVFGQPLVPPSNPTVPVFGQPLSSSSNPTVPAFGQSLVSPSPPGFMFGSTAPQCVSPFQFGGQQNQAAIPIPSFQASNSGGSFSLGFGAGDKGSRKMVRISENRNRKK